LEIKIWTRYEYLKAEGLMSWNATTLSSCDFRQWTESERRKKLKMERGKVWETNGMKKSIVRGGFGGNRTENTGRNSSRHYFALSLPILSRWVEHTIANAFFCFRPPRVPISQRKQICIRMYNPTKYNQRLSIKNILLRF